MSLYRNVVITSWANEIVYEASNASYIIYHREKCPDTGRLHYHIYVELSKRMRLNAIKTMFNDNTIHVESRRGTQKQAIDYVCKDENEYPIVEKGTRKKQGERNDIKAATRMIEDGKSMLEVASECPIVYVKYSKGLERYKMLQDASKTKAFRQVEVLVYVGAAGVGKTRRVLEENEDYYKLDCANNLWFDGYDGQSCLVIDDFYGWIKYGHLLNILDGYQLRLEIKGGFTYAKWNRVCITSNKPPNEWYAQGMTPALERRISSIFNL